MDADIKALVDKKLLSTEEGDDLQWIFRARGGYVADHCYGARRNGSVNEKDSAQAASQWVVEMQLDLLRRTSRVGTLDSYLEDAIRVNLVKECSFLKQLAALQPSVPEDASEAKDKDRTDEASVKQAQDDVRKRMALIESYLAGKVPRNREMERLVPLLMEMTKATPLPAR